MPHLTLITVSHRNLPGLVSLFSQIQTALSSDVAWVIKDSGDCQATAAWGASIDNINVQFISEPDKGIYSALNRSLSECSSEFYLVVGSDDSIEPRAIIAIGEMIRSGKFATLDVASFPVMIDGRPFRRKRMRPHFVSVSGLISSHSVGTIIRRSLHDTAGLYDENYRILADALFIRRAYQAGARFRHFEGPTTGSFSLSGVSSTQHSRRILEAYSYNVLCGDSPALQAIIMMWRIMKNKPLTLI